MNRRAAVARRAGPAGRDGGDVPRVPGGGRCPGLPALRLLGRRLVPTDYERWCPHSAGSSRLAAATRQRLRIHFGVGWTGPAPMLPRRRRRRRARLAHADRTTRRRLGHRDVVVQGNLDPALVPAPARTVRPRPGGARRQRRPPRPHLQPRPRRPSGETDPGVLAAIVDLVHAELAAMRTGVLLMAYGTPRAPEQIETYYTDIRRGRPPRRSSSPTCSPLRGHRRHVAAGSTHRSPARCPAGASMPGAGQSRRADRLKHADPKIEAGLAALAQAGVDRVVGLVLAPHYSALSVGEYLGAGPCRRRRGGAAVRRHRELGHRPAYVQFLLRVRRQLAEMPAPKVIVTAHSLPRGILEAGDPYPDELWRAAAAVAAAGLADRRVGGRLAIRRPHPDPWLGPDVLTVIEELAASGRRWAPRVPVRVRVRSPRGALRPRHRARSAGPVPRVDVRPNGVDERRCDGDRCACRTRHRPR